MYLLRTLSSRLFPLLRRRFMTQSWSSNRLRRHASINSFIIYHFQSSSVGKKPIKFKSAPPKKAATNKKLPRMTDEMKIELKRMLDCFSNDRPYANMGKSEIITFCPYLMHELNEASIKTQFTKVIDIWFTRALPLFSIRHSEYGYKSAPLSLKYLGLLNSKNHGLVKKLGYDAVEFMTKVISDDVGFQNYDDDHLADTVMGIGNLTCQSFVVQTGANLVNFFIALDDHISTSNSNTKSPNPQLLLRNLFGTLETTEWSKLIGCIGQLFSDILKHQAQLARRPSVAFLTYLHEWCTDSNSRVLKPASAKKLIYNVSNILRYLWKTEGNQPSDQFLINDLIRLGFKCMDTSELYAKNASRSLARLGTACCDYKPLSIRIEDKNWTKWFECVKKRLIRENDQYLLCAVIRVTDQYNRIGDFNAIKDMWNKGVLEIGSDLKHQNAVLILKHLKSIEKKESIKIDTSLMRMLEPYEQKDTVDNSHEKV